MRSRAKCLGVSKSYCKHDKVRHRAYQLARSGGVKGRSASQVESSGLPGGGDARAGPFMGGRGAVGAALRHQAVSRAVNVGAVGATLRGARL